MHRKARAVVVGPVVRASLLCGSIALLAACAGRAASSDASDAAVLTGADVVAALEKCCGDSAVGVGLRIAADYKEPSITTRRFSAAQFWLAVQPMAEYARFDVTAVGQSVMASPLRTITIGSGPTKLLVWSRMNGDQSTGTVALADLVRWFANTRAEDRDIALRERLLAGLTIVLLPILNPEDALRGDSSLQRSAALLEQAGELPSASEVRVLNAVRNRLQPDFEIALIDRGAPERADEATATYAAISLLARQNAVAGADNTADERALRAAATLAKSFLTELPGRVVRFDSSRDLSALNGLIADSRVSTVVVASGDLEADPQNQRLRSLHVAALLSAFDALSTGAYVGANAALYEQLPRNAGRVVPARR